MNEAGVNAETDWAWLVGRFQNPQEFEAIGHVVVHVGQRWHSAIDPAAVTVCGRAIDPTSPRRPEIYTTCDECGSTLAQHRQAVHVPWTIVSEMLRTYWAAQWKAEQEGVTA